MSSPIALPQSPELYLPFYRDELIGIGASGREVEGEQGQQLLRSIRRCVNDGIRVLIAYGGGGPINTLYEERYGAKRQKVNGYAVTDERVLGCAIDIHERIQQQLLAGLREVLPDCPVDVIPPHEVVCAYKDFGHLQYVGNPLRVDHDLTAPVTLVGFNGFVGGQRTNVNKDDIARILAPQMVENFLVTPTRGIVENYDPEHPENGKIVPVVFAENIQEDGSLPGIAVGDGMLLKLQNAKAMSADARTVITGGEDIPDELYSVGGKGTLVIDKRKIVAGHPTAKELAVVRYVIEQYEKAGVFRVRSQQQKALVLRNHLILREHTPLAGCSLIPFEDGSMELGTLWSGYNGMGKILVNKAKEHFLRQPFCTTLFALSMPDDPANEPILDPALQRFLRNGFRCRGRMSEAKGKKGMPEHLGTYNTGERNPYLFVLTRQELIATSP